MKQKLSAFGAKAMKFLRKLGKSLMLPVACMPLCGILMGIGYLLCPTTMQGGDSAGALAVVGTFLVKAGSALIDNIPILFAIGVGVGMSDDGDGVGALSSLVSWLMITTLLSKSSVLSIVPSVAESPVRELAFDKISNPFIGILAGVIGSYCYNRFKNTRLPSWLSFFSGKRCVAIVSGAASIAVSLLLFLVWPVLFSALVAMGKWIAGLGTVGAGIYAVLNRLLIPSGLHHALNNVFWFDTIGLGDLNNFWAGKTSADVGWSLGMYMSGFFPCMMFGNAGAALAIYLRTAEKHRKKAAGILLSSIICSFICGVTEPFEFSFMFICPPLFVVYALLYGVMTVVTLATGFRAGFSFSGGMIDLIFSSNLPAAQRTWLIIPLGILSFALFFGAFYLIVKKLGVTVFGDEAEAETPFEEASGGDKYSVMAEKIYYALGGKDNIVSIDNCITRLRLELRDTAEIDEKAIRAAGSRGVIRLGKTDAQVIIGTDVQFVADNMKRLFDGAYEKSAAAPRAEIFPISADELILSSPVSGKFVEMSDIPDPVFSEGVLGACCAIEPESGVICAPADGEIIQIADTLHSVCLDCGGIEVLIHAGVDTVKLGGNGFECPVSLGDKVKKGQTVLLMDTEKISAKGFSTDVITVVAGTEPEEVRFEASGYVKQGETLAKIKN